MSVSATACSVKIETGVALRRERMDPVSFSWSVSWFFCDLSAIAIARPIVSYFGGNQTTHQWWIKIYGLWIALYSLCWNGDWMTRYFAPSIEPLCWIFGETCNSVAQSFLMVTWKPTVQCFRWPSVMCSKESEWLQGPIALSGLCRHKKCLSETTVFASFRIGEAEYLGPAMLLKLTPYLIFMCLIIISILAFLTSKWQRIFFFQNEF